MPRNPTTGVFTRVSNSFSNPVVGTVIDPGAADPYFDDIDEGLSENFAQTVGPSFANVAAVVAANVFVGIVQITTRSYFGTSLYGGGTYNRVGSAPSHALYITSLDGAFWELQPTEGKVFATQAGAIPDGVEGVFVGGTDNQTPINNAYTYSLAKNVQLYFETAGVYNKSGTTVLGDNTGNKIPNIDFVGPDMAVVIQHTGTGANFTLDSSVAGITGGIVGLTGRPLFTGNPATTYNLDHRYYSGIILRVFSGDAATSGVRIRGTISSIIDVASSTNQRPVYGTKPNIALEFSDPATNGQSTNCLVITKLEGMINGMSTNGLQSSTIRGTSEGNSGYGYLGSGLSGNNTFQNFFCEGNGNSDFNFNGEFNSTLDNCVGVSTPAVSLQINGPNIKVIGGVFYNITMLAGAIHTSFSGAGYQNAFDNTLGAATTWKDLYSINLGTGARTYIVDKVSADLLPVAQGGTGRATFTAGELLIGNGASPVNTITIPTVLDAQLGTTQGSIAYRNAGFWIGLAPGTSGQSLLTQGAGANPVFGYPAASTLTGLGTGVAAALTNTLNAASGLVGFSGTLGAATATSINKVAFTAPATAATLTILNNKTATFNNSITFAGTDGTTMTFPVASGAVLTADSTNTVTGKSISGSANTLSNINTNSILDFGNLNAGLVGGATVFVGAAGGSPTEINVQTPMPYDVTLDKFFGSFNTAPVGGQTYIVTVRKAGVDTALTFTVTGSATTGNDTTHSVAFAAGDLFSIKIVASATAATTAANNFSVRGVIVSP